MSFTGHSLGGGLAALMAMFFDKQAVTFDPAPFRKTIESKTTLVWYQTSLGILGFSDARFDELVYDIPLVGEDIAGKRNAGIYFKHALLEQVLKFTIVTK